MAQQYEEKDTTVNMINLLTLTRGGGNYTSFFKEEVLPEHLSSVIEDATKLLDTNRFVYTLGSMDKGGITQAMATAARRSKLITGWKEMSAGVETLAEIGLDKITQEHKGVALLLESIIKRNFNTAKFNRMHRMGKLARAIDAVKILSPNLNTVTDIIFIYTPDGIQSTMDIKELYGKLELENYPEYWSLYYALKISELLGIKIFNIGKEGMLIGLEEFLAKNFDATESPIATIRSPLSPIPVYWKGKTTEELYSQEPTKDASANATTYTAPSTGVKPPNINAVEQINIVDPIADNIHKPAQPELSSVVF